MLANLVNRGHLEIELIKIRLPFWNKIFWNAEIYLCEINLKQKNLFRIYWKLMIIKTIIRTCICISYLNCYIIIMYEKGCWKLYIHIKIENITNIFTKKKYFAHIFFQIKNSTKKYSKTINAVFLRFSSSKILDMQSKQPIFFHFAVAVLFYLLTAGSFKYASYRKIES